MYPKKTHTWSSSTRKEIQHCSNGENANQNHYQIPLSVYPLDCIILKDVNNGVDKDVEKYGFSYVAHINT